MVSIVIVNYNTFSLTSDCIRSVIANTQGVAYEIVLVDNASDECRATLFKEHFPHIKLVVCARNEGFAKGNNAGIKVASGEVLLLLNSDTVLTEDAVSKAVAYLFRNPRTGALTVRLHYPNGRVQHYARRYKALKYELLDLARPLLYLLPYRRRATLMLNQYYKGDFDVRCDWVGGAFMMMPRVALETLPAGRLDDRYFMYGEDQLWCMQLARQGWEVRCFAGTSVVHLEGGSNKATAGRKWRGLLLQRELELYRLRWGGGLKYTAFAGVFALKRAAAFVLLKCLGK